MSITVTERKGQMGDGNILMRYFVNTLNPIESLPTYFATVHSIATDPSYFSVGRLRQGERHCMFHYTLSGEGICYSKHGVERVHAGEGFLGMVYDTDSGYMYPDDGHEPWEFVCFCFAGEYALELTKRLMDEYGRIYRVDKHNPVMKGLLELGKDEQPRINMSAFVSADWAFSIFSMLIRSANEGRAGLMPQNPAVLKVRELVDENIKSELTVDFLVSGIGYSREHLCRLFRHETGMNIREYIQKRRILEACHLLKESNMSINEISEALHYNSQSNFSRSFKHIMALSPSEFREKGMIPLFDI